MSNWIREAKEVKQSKYGGYCLMCRKLGIKPKPYHSFKVEDHKKLKKQINGTR